MFRCSINRSHERIQIQHDSYWWQTMKVGVPGHTAHGLGRLSSRILNRERPNPNFPLFHWSFELSHKGLCCHPAAESSRVGKYLLPTPFEIWSWKISNPGPPASVIIGTPQPFAEGYGRGVDWAFVSVILLSASWSRLDCLPHCLHSLPSTHMPFILTIATACHLSVL